MTEEVATLPEHWGQLGHLSSAQSEALNQLLGEIPREQIDIAKYSTETDEQVALRFLRARQFDITRTKELLAECYKRKVDGKAKVIVLKSQRIRTHLFVIVLRFVEA